MIERRIMVVDDEEPIRKVFAKFLRRVGYEVRTAESGEEALEMLESEPCWVFFLDLNLPGMNGLELSKRIRTEWPMSIMYAVTGYASLFELSECRTVGFEDYFSKPVDLKTLQKAAEEAFAKLDRWKGGD